MSEQEPRLSVRAQSAVSVPPDSVLLSGAVRTAGPDKVTALAQAARALTALTNALSALGAVPLDADHVRSALTWSAQSTTSEPETGEDEATGRWRATGRVVATVAVEIVARDFDALAGVESALAAQAAFAVHNTSWRVDNDNPAWTQVRADAIHAAVAKARDYAAALGGRMAGVEHIADAGLLGGSGAAEFGVVMQSSADWSMSRSGGGEETPSLDPVPCELTATIDARFTATGISLD
jgi:uncharacterized protein YggE